MMIRRTIYLIIFLLGFSLAFANQPDSLILSLLLKKGKLLELNNKDSAMIVYKSILVKADSIGLFNREIADISAKLANYEYYRGNTEMAITLALRALRYYEEKAESKKTTQVMILVGDILRGNELYDQSREYLFNAMNKAKEQDDSGLLMNASNRIAALGIDDTRIPQDTSERYAMLSLEIARKQQNDSMIYNNLNILGVLEIQRGNYHKSLAYLVDALKIAQTSFGEDEPLILHNMARNKFLLGHTGEAVGLEKRAFQLAHTLNIPQYVRLASSYLKDYYRSVGNYQEALYYTIQYYDAKEFILTQKVLVQLKEFNNRMEAEKQHLENQRLIYEKKLTDGRLRNFMIAGVLLAILLIMTTGFMFYQRRQRQHIRKIATQLDQSNTVLKRFISVLGHDLRSPFNALIGFTDLLKNEPSLSSQEREKAIERLYNVTRSTYRLLERILEWSQLQSGFVKPVMKSCDLSELIRDPIHILEPAALLKNIRISYHYPGPVTIFADENMILTVIRNILSNAIKFSHQGTNIEIGISSEKNPVSLYIRDNGIGISHENLDRLFQLDNNYKSQGTAGEAGTGLGLILCREYISMHGGKLEVTSQEGKGSTFTIILP
ncbi:MAG: tetratricopeptide repeat-containing sensor histidine kinase [Bacteroidales bacterium]|nr:tetratricopeptide repeat-containing sensor histidine kinase [Bacteroidales bacterium]